MGEFPKISQDQEKTNLKLKEFFLYWLADIFGSVEKFIYFIYNLIDLKFINFQLKPTT